MIIAVDFDGTIVEHLYPLIGEEIVPALDVLTQAQLWGHKIILWTCREGIELQQAVTWLKENYFIPDAVNKNLVDWGANCRSKIYADWYIDDRSVFPHKHPDWYLIRKQLLGMGVAKC